MSRDKQQLKPFQLIATALEIGGLYRAADDERTPLTLMLHSSGGGAQSLAPLAKRLRVPGSIVIPDLCGYGSTRATTSSNDGALEQHLNVIEAVVQEYCHGDQPMVVIGHSMGGFLALLTALHRQVAAMVAIEPVAFSVLDPIADAAARAEDQAVVMGLHESIRSGDAEPGLARFIGYWGGSEWTELSEEARTALLPLAPQMGHETFAVANDTTAPEAYTKISSPVLLMQGADTRAPAQAVIHRLSELLSDVSAVTIERAGHMGPVRQPSVYAEQINAFIQRRV